MTGDGAIEACRRELASNPRNWVVTGVAGFIGSHLLEELLRLGQVVTGVDNFSTGSPKNLSMVRSEVGEERWKRFRFVEGDICDLSLMEGAVAGASHVLHQAALGSVPRSVKDPVATNRANVDGFLSVLTASRNRGVSRFVYASSSSVYGDSQELPKVEERIGKPLSPYAVTKQVNELYASVFGPLYGMEITGLRYFNVFGPRQNPEGAYAAVIPRWIGEQLQGIESIIYGDGETSRDFCYVRNVVEANLLAACSPAGETAGRNYNVALGHCTSLNELFSMIREELESGLDRSMPGKRNEGFRPGDVRHSLADISSAKNLLGYQGRYSLREGLRETVGWYMAILRDS